MIGQITEKDGKIKVDTHELQEGEQIKVLVPVGDSEAWIDTIFTFDADGSPMLLGILGVQLVGLFAKVPGLLVI